MKRLGAGLVFAVVLLGVASCSGKAPEQTAPTTSTTTRPVTTTTPAGTPTSSVPPSVNPSATSLIEFSVDGAGPYQLGQTLTTLQAVGLDEVKSGAAPCPSTTTARGTGTWHDVYLSFRSDGVLYLAVNRSASIPTPSGAWLGSSLTQLKTIYSQIPGQIVKRGSNSGYLVTTLSGTGILFDLGTGSTVQTMLAGEANYLKTAYSTSGNYC